MALGDLVDRHESIEKWISIFIRDAGANPSIAAPRGGHVGGIRGHPETGSSRQQASRKCHQSFHDAVSSS